MSISRQILPVLAAFALVGACDSKDAAKADTKADAKKADAKTPDKAPDAKTPDAKTPDAETPDAEAGADAEGKDAADAPKDIVDTAVAAGSFKTLATALEKAGLIETLKGPGPFTVFAPTDDAFAKVPKEALDALLANPEELKKVLLMHVVSGKVMAEDALKLQEAEMMSGDKLPIDATDGASIGGAKITQTDIAASNGVIHVIDTVILPKA